MGEQYRFVVEANGRLTEFLARQSLSVKSSKGHSC